MPRPCRGAGGSGNWPSGWGEVETGPFRGTGGVAGAAGPGAIRAIAWVGTSLAGVGDFRLSYRWRPAHAVTSPTDIPHGRPHQTGELPSWQRTADLVLCGCRRAGREGGDSPTGGWGWEQLTVSLAGGAWEVVRHVSCLGRIIRQEVVGCKLWGVALVGGWLPARGNRCRQVQE